MARLRRERVSSSYREPHFLKKLLLLLQVLLLLPTNTNTTTTKIYDDDYGSNADDETFLLFEAVIVKARWRWEQQ